MTFPNDHYRDIHPENIAKVLEEIATRQLSESDSEHLLNFARCVRKLAALAQN
jgi:hypothetical protein